MYSRIWLLIVLLPGRWLSAEVTLPSILTNHMVVQRDRPVHIWGTATPGEAIAVQFRGHACSTATDALGRWSCYLPPGPAGGPFEMTIKGSTPVSRNAAEASQTLTLGDILVGDVWIASGQSNMEFTLNRASTGPADLPYASIPGVRLLLIKHHAAEFPQDDAVTEGWVESSPETAQNFSAVAWYFARQIERREHVPIGIVDSTWGGTPVEAWTRMAALGEEAALAPLFTSWGRFTEQQADVALSQRNIQRQIAEAEREGKPKPQMPAVRDASSWAPAALYNGMIAPLTPLTIRGFIWYQGESNTFVDRAPLYGLIFRTMVEDWRRQWALGDLPFLFVQISGLKSNPDRDWPRVREEQRRSLELRNTAMAVTIDIGNPDNIHPADKLDVGLRLALAARALSYGESIEYSGPLFRQATPEGAAIRVWFDHAKSLVTKSATLTGFEVAGADRKFVPASASIDGNTVLASSPSVPTPLYVRYGWSDNPDCHLFNGEGLPASPFTSLE